MLRRGLSLTGRTYQRYFVRTNSTWYNPLSKFKRDAKPGSTKQQITTTSNGSNFIIEEPDNIPHDSNPHGGHQQLNHQDLKDGAKSQRNQPDVHTAIMRDFKHYLKTDIPNKLQKRILTDKLNQYIVKVSDFDRDKSTIPMLNKVFMRLFALHNGSLTSMISFSGDASSEEASVKEETIPYANILKLFERSTMTITGKQARSHDNFYVPEYVALLAKYFLSESANAAAAGHQNATPARIFVYVVELSNSVIKQSSIGTSLSMLFKNTHVKLTPEFTNSLVKYWAWKGRLSLFTFKEILETTVASGRYDEIIDGEFFNSYISYIEKLYKEVPPRTHEYKEMEKSIERVQGITSSIVRLLLENTSIHDSQVSSYLKMVKLTSELNSVCNNIELPEGSTSLLQALFDAQQDKQLFFELVRRELYAQDLGDDSLAETLLLLSWNDKSKKLLELAEMLSSFIVSDDIKFSFESRLQAKVAETIHTKTAGGKISESEIFDDVKKDVELFISKYNSLEHESKSNLDIPTIHSKVIQMALTSDSIKPRGYFTQSLTKYFQDSLGMSDAPSVYSYKYQLDKSILTSNHVQAVNIFEDSLENFVQWPADSDPMIALSLNNLIICICKEMDNVEDIFPIFTKIKQQMVNCQCNIDAINAMTRRMLENEFVGDTIEFLKRELPKIGKEDALKLPCISSPKYRQLFEILHGFVLNYKKEPTFETNWVLYGEVHRYFHVPYEYYLPAMKFFCENDRQNAALIIFRQMLRLNDSRAHSPDLLSIGPDIDVNDGKNVLLPPSREHYMYLFSQFGNKLYEEGVEELYEYLKMDVAIPEQDIALQNTILNAFSNLQDVPRTKDLFLAMSTTPGLCGGINEETIQIMIKTYTYSDMVYVKKFWDNLSAYGVIPDYSIFKQYLIAHVYHGLVNEAISLTATEMKDYEIEMSEDLLASMFNYTLDSSKQDVIAQWAEKEHPEEWEGVKVSGALKAAGKYRPDTSLLVEGQSYEADK